MSDKEFLLYEKISQVASITTYGFQQLFQAVNSREVKKVKNLKAGQICKHIYFMEKGHFRVFYEKNGEIINTDFVFESEFTTNLKSLRSARPSEATIQAGEDAVFYEFEKEKLVELYKNFPEIESFGRRLLEHLLIQQEEHGNLFKILSPAERYQYLLTNKPHIIQRVSLSHLASYIGIARETLSRIRKKSSNGL